MRIEADKFSMEELLTNSYFFIPRFQRPYSWELEHVQEFWKDLVQNLGKAYFIGSMVVYEAQNRKLAVVDGQQRLTTITILLCAIRDRFETLDRTDLAEGLQNYIERTNRDNENIFVLQTESSFPFLQDQVLNWGQPDLEHDVGREEEAIQKAARKFSEELDSALLNQPESLDNGEDGRVEWLKSLRDTVLDLSVIKVELEKEEDAYIIFETLNTRGKDLALSDLVKNHFSKLLPARGDVDAASVRWNKVLTKIEESPEDLAPDTFITHFWQSRYDFLTKAKVFPKLKSDIKRNNAREFLTSFEHDATIWRSIFDTDFGWSSSERKARELLEAIRLFRVVQPTPGILSLVRSYRDGQIKLGKLCTALQSIVNFHFQFTAVTSSRSSGGISGMYASFGRKMFESSDSGVASAEIRSLRNKLKERLPTELEFDAGFEQVIYTKSNTSQRNLVRYILLNLATHQRHPMIGATTDLTIEHLVPQADITNSENELDIGQIGNLLLVDPDTNQKLGAKSFSEKKSILLEAGYHIPDGFIELDKLDSAALREQTAKIAEVARNEIWTV